MPENWGIRKYPNEQQRQIAWDKLHRNEPYDIVSKERQELINFIDDRGTFTAQIKRFGKANGWNGQEDITILLVNVFSENKIVADHLWIKKGKQWDSFKPGDYVQFNARATYYIKGYHRDDENLKLERPTKVKKISKPKSNSNKKT